MDIYVGKQRITLTQNQFVAKGGEGSIFKRENIAYKIYEDHKKMIPPGKIQELEVLNDPFILNPKELIKDNNTNLIGFTTDWANDCTPMARLFTTSFRDANHITNDTTIVLIEFLKNKTHHIHSKNCLVVDYNELNLLAAPGFITAYFIDVNSWETPNYPATAIMDSIRDWTTSKFTPLTDWFSFAVISFQLFVGLHPFKGKHKDPSKEGLQKRVVEHISVFNKDIGFPPSTRSFDLIPSKYKDWFYSLFEKGERKLPPDLPGAIVVAQVITKLILSTDKLEITDIREYESNILYHNPNGEITKTMKTIWLNRTEYPIGPNVEFVSTPLEGYPILVKIEDGEVKFKGLSLQVESLNLACESMAIINNSLYLKYEGNLSEITFIVLNGVIRPVVKNVWPVSPLSSKIFTNCIYQSLLGKPYIVIPIPSFKQSSFITKQIPELEGFQVLDSKYENHVCMVVYHTGQVYNKLIIVFNEDFSKYTTRILEDVHTSVNFTVLENGVCIHIPEDGKMEVFFNNYKFGNTSIKMVEDSSIVLNMKLIADRNKVRFFTNNKLYGVTLKK
jgi:hypothetical protein